MATSGHYKLDIRIDITTQVIGDNLYLWGGNDTSSIHNNDEKRRLTSQIAIFNITSGIWNFRSTNGYPPLGVQGYLCTSINDKIYYFGGLCHYDSCYHNSLNVLDISTLTWTQLQSSDDNLIVMKRGFGGIISSEQAGGHHCLLLVGGQGTPPSILLPQAQYFQYRDGRVRTNEQNIYDLTTGQWIIPEIVGHCMPSNSGFVMETVNKTRAIIFGGLVEGTSSNTLYVVDIINCTVHWQTIAKPDPIVQWPDERDGHASSIISGSISPILVVIGGVDKTNKIIKDCWILDVNEKLWTKIYLPDSVTERYIHSLSTFIMGPYCVWLIVIGGKVQHEGANVTDPNITILIELVLNNGQWSIGFVLDSNGLSVIKAVYDDKILQKKSRKDERNESSQEKSLQFNYRKEQENIKSLQERLIDMEFQHVLEKDSYIAELKNKDEIITTLQKQLEQSNQQISTTSDHHDLQQLLHLVQEKDSYIAQLNRRLLTLSKEKEDALQQIKVASYQQLSQKSSQKTKDVLSYLPKLAVVLQPVQQYWEQLGLQLNIDQSVLTDIRSKGDSTEQMKCLLEEWSLKGGTLTQLEEALLHVDMKHIIPGLLDLQDKIQISSDFSEKSIQCDYWNYTNISDLFEGMVTVGKKLCLYNAHTEHELILEECGLRLIIPGEIITPIESVYEVATQGLWGAGKFNFPEGCILISGVCYISVSSSSELNKPVTVELMHCAHITDERQTQYLCFVAAKSGPPFKFDYLPGGSFSSESQYGTISLKQFSLLAIVLVISGAVVGGAAAVVSGVGLGVGSVVAGVVAGGLIGHSLADAAVGHHQIEVDNVPIPNIDYQAYVCYKNIGPKTWYMSFAVTQDIDYSKFVQELTSTDKFGLEHSNFRFQFATKTSQEQEQLTQQQVKREEILLLSGFDESMTPGWKVKPLLIPPVISKRAIDDFNQSRSASLPYIRVLIHGDPNTKEELECPLTIEGIELATADSNPPKVVIYSESLVSNYTHSSLITHDEVVKHSAVGQHSLLQDVFRTHYAKLSRLVSVSNNRLPLANELFSTQLITLDCYDCATDNAAKTDMEKGVLLMRGLMNTINTEPQLLPKLINILKKLEVFKSVSENMQHDLL